MPIRYLTAGESHGPALVGIELGAREDLQPLLRRMDASSLQIEPIQPDSPLFRFIL